MVVHLPGGTWWVIDSFQLDGRPKRHGASWYLEQIGVEPVAVEAIVVTHFHADHYHGIDLLLDDCPNSRLFITAGLPVRWVEEIFKDEATLDEQGPARAAALAQERSRQANQAGVVELKAGMVPRQQDGQTIRALAPVEAALAASRMDLLALAEAGGDRKRMVRERLQKQNRTSVVLHVDVGFAQALLTGDMERSPKNMGWAAIVGEPLNAGVTPTSLLKVPHHGSQNGVSQEMWQLVGDSPTMLLAPNTRHNLPIPEDQDPGGVLTQLKERGPVWRAVPPPIDDEAHASIEPEFGIEILPDVGVGAAVARRGPADDTWHVTPLGEAAQA